MTSKESRSDKGLCNNYLVGGGGAVGKLEGGIGEMTTREKWGWM